MRNTESKIIALAAVAGAALFARRMLRPQYSFRGKVVVISGGSRGLGLVIARQLAREGAHLVLCSRTKHQLLRAQEELTATGANVLGFTCDITDRKDVQ